MKHFIYLVLISLIAVCTYAQKTDSLPRLVNQSGDSVGIRDTLLAIPFKDTLPSISIKQHIASDSLFKVIIARNSFFSSLKPAVNNLQIPAVQSSKTWLFYLVAALVFMLVLLRKIYTRYFNDIFRVYFRTTLRQEQIRDQLMQSRLPSLFFNIYFFFAAGVYLFLLARYYQVPIQSNPYKALLGCIAVVTLLYMGKLLAVRVLSWIFGVYAISETYIFIVFMANKIIGLVLVPFITLIALSSTNIAASTLTLSYLAIGFLFIYRFFRTYGPVQKEIKLSAFHFFIYLCAFEIAPLLLIYKLLLNYF